MSWYVEGRRYRTAAEYQRAQAEAERIRAERAAGHLAEENRRLQAEIIRDREEMESGAGIGRQQQIAHRIDTRVRALERNRSRIEEFLAKGERRMQDGLDQMERDLADSNGKLHGMETDVEQLRSGYRQSLENFRNSLESARAEARHAVARAERDREEAEARLQQAVSALNRKLESDHAAQAARHANQLSLAKDETETAVQAAVQCEAEAWPLGLDSDLQQLKSHLDSARALIARGESSAALATASMARAGAESLERELHARRQEMDGARAEVESRLARIEDAACPSASVAMRDCYAPELLRLHSTLAAARDRLAKRYRDYRLLPVERREDEDLLNDVEGEILEITASAPGVAEAAQRRVQQLEEVLDGLEKVYGSMTTATQSFAKPGDPKSDLVVDAVFGSSKVLLTVALDGSISLDGYGHGNARECAAAADRVIEELRNRTEIGTVSKDQEARQHPQDAARDGGQVSAQSGGKV